MSTLRMPAGAGADRVGAEGRPQPVKRLDDARNPGLLEGELLDLYGAILIVVPLALFLKSLWF
jgi:hypothetical protein